MSQLQEYFDLYYASAATEDDYSKKKKRTRHHLNAAITRVMNNKIVLGTLMQIILYRTGFRNPYSISIREFEERTGMLYDTIRRGIVSLSKYDFITVTRERQDGILTFYLDEDIFIDKLDIEVQK